MGFIDRLQHGWNAFLNRDPTVQFKDAGSSSYYRPDRPRLRHGNDRTIITAVYNRIAVDVSSIDIKHIRLDANERYAEDINSGLNYCLNTEANIDQTNRAFIRDVVLSLFDEGCVAVVPVDTTINPKVSGAFDVDTLRVGRIREWRPEAVLVNLYNDKTGLKEDVWVLKKYTAIIENPFYPIMNEPNSTAKRLMRKLVLLDAVDEQTSAGKLDLIVQLPYAAKTELKMKQAEDRRKALEQQLTGSRYGIAYIDSTEHVTQLNRSLENNLLSQIDGLRDLLYSQLGVTKEVMDGTADEKTMLNYNNRTIEPVITAIVDEFRRKFLTKTARSQKQTIAFFKDPFKLVPIANIAEIADKFTRNEIMSSNEMRQIVGLKPSSDPNADVLRNKNINQATGMMQPMDPNMIPEESPEDLQNGIDQLDELDSQLDDLEEIAKHSDDDLMHYASPYYDPEKAHEYYMENRELVDRKSTSGLNDKGREAARYVKKQLMAEKKVKKDDNNTNTKNTVTSNSEATKTQTKSNSEATSAAVKSNSEWTQATIKGNNEYTKDAITNYSEQISNQITSLSDKLKKMGPAFKEKHRDEIAAQIKNLREQNASKREELQSRLKEVNDGLRKDNQNTNTNLRDDNKVTNTKLRETNAATNKQVRADNTAANKQLDSDYEDMYVSELDKIRNTRKFQK